MIVSELAQSLGITADTVRFYTREGFLKPARNTLNGYKEYSSQDKSRLRFILSARNLGFTVEDIRQILGEADQGKTACPLVRQVINERLQQMEQRLNDAQRLRDRMLAAVKEWDKKPDHAPTGHMICHLIEEFATD